MSGYPRIFGWIGLVVVLIVVGGVLAPETAAAVCTSQTDCSVHGSCVNGACFCDNGFAGETCNQCAANFFNFPSCTSCNAATTCSGHGSCTATGACACHTGFAGPGCNQ
jgi:hypothetical protein